MLITDEDALICDLAETYHIYDWRQYPVIYIATLALGLRDDSRIMQKINGYNLDVEKSLLAMAVDGINLLGWMQSENGRKGTNRPKSILKTLIGKDRSTSKDVLLFDSIEEFEQARKRMINGE